MAQPGQMMASDLRGSNVYSANNENVGDIKDILLERDGRVAAIVIGVGGFLGMGEKNVALPFEAFDFTSGAAGAGVAPRDPQTTGTVGSDRSAAQRGSMGAMKPERIVLKSMMKADLESAPSFGQAGSSSAPSAPRSSSDPAAPARR
jgi:hypothetical protein